MNRILGWGTRALAVGMISVAAFGAMSTAASAASTSVSGSGSGRMTIKFPPNKCGADQFHQVASGGWTGEATGAGRYRVDVCVDLGKLIAGQPHAITGSMRVGAKHAHFNSVVDGTGALTGSAYTYVLTATITGGRPGAGQFRIEGSSVLVKALRNRTLDTDDFTYTGSLG